MPKLALALFLALWMLGVGRAATAQERNFITFEAPGADTTGDNNGTYPSSINNWGAITGSYQDTNNTFHGFFRHPDGKITTFEAPGADTGPFNGTSPISINDYGTITGSYYDVNGLSHGFLRSPDGEFTTFDAPGVGGYGTFPIAINLEGSVVGYYSDSNFSNHAFLRSPDGKMTTWVGPDECTGTVPEGCDGSGATNINIFGFVVGGFRDNSGNFVHHGLVRSPEGKLKTFDVPGAGTGSYQGTGCSGCALGFNQWGAIAGIYVDPNYVFAGFLRSPEGKFTTFDAPNAGAFIGTTSLNDCGAITGTYIDANNVVHGYLRSREGKVLTVDPSGSGGTNSLSINDSGAITGYYVDANNVWHGFLRVPD